MSIIKIPKDEMLDILEDNVSGCSLIEDKIIGKNRWTIVYRIIFLYKNGKYYSTTYRVGATEYQDESPWEYENEVECIEVKPIEKTITVYENIIS